MLNLTPDNAVEYFLDNILVNMTESPPPNVSTTTADLVTALSDALSRIQVTSTASDLESLTKIEDLPQFLPADPEFWFTTLESQFSLRGIKRDDIKFSCIVARPPRELCLYIKAENADQTPLAPNQTRYQRFKERVNRAFKVSEDAKLKQLIRSQPMLADKPSQMLVQLQNLAGTSATPALLRNVFLEQMPENIRPILAATQIQDVNKLAEIADSIIENISPHKYVNAVSDNEPSDIKALFELQKQQVAVQLSQDTLIKSMAETLKTLSAQVEKLQKFRSRSRSRPKNVFADKNQSSDNVDFCRYHNRYGRLAHRCEHPCAFNFSSKNVEGHQ